MPRRGLVAIAAVGVVAVGLVVVLLGSSSTTGPSAYMLSNDQGILFIRWTSDGSSVQGSLTVFTPSSYVPEGGTAETHAFTGVVGGNSVSLHFASGFDYSALSGRLTTDGLVISYPSSGGQFADVTLRRSSETDYNGAVSGFAGQAASAIASEQAKEQRNAPVADAAQTLKAAMDQLANMPDLRSLRPFVNEIDPDANWHYLAALQARVAEIKAGLARLKANPSLYDFGLELGITYNTYFCGDEYAPDAHDGKAASDAVSSEAQAIAQVSAATEALKQTVALHPEADPASPSVADGQAAIDAAQGEVTAAKATWESVIKTANDYRAEAHSYYMQGISVAQKAGRSVSACSEPRWAAPW